MNTIKKSVFWSIFLIPFLFTTSCRDTPDNLIEDMRMELEDVCNALENYEKGKISERAIVERIQLYKANRENFDERIKELKKRGKLDNNTPVDPRMQKELGVYYRRYSELIMRITVAGKYTPAFGEATSGKSKHGYVPF